MNQLFWEVVGWLGYLQRTSIIFQLALIIVFVVYWRLVDHARAFYEVGDLSLALKNVVLTQIRSEIGKIDLDATFTNRQEINEALLRDLDQIHISLRFLLYLM